MKLFHLIMRAIHWTPDKKSTWYKYHEQKIKGMNRMQFTETEIELLKLIITDWHGEAFQSKESYSEELVVLLEKLGVKV